MFVAIPESMLNFKDQQISLPICNETTKLCAKYLIDYTIGIVRLGKLEGHNVGLLNSLTEYLTAGSIRVS